MNKINKGQIKSQRDKEEDKHHNKNLIIIGSG